MLANSSFALLLAFLAKKTVQGTNLRAGKVGNQDESIQGSLLTENLEKDHRELGALVDSIKYDEVYMLRVDGGTDYVGHENFLVKLLSQPNQYTTSWWIRPCLNDSVCPYGGKCISFENTDWNGYYLTHQNFVTNMARQEASEQYRSDASFCLLDTSSSGGRQLLTIQSFYTDFHWGVMTGGTGNQLSIENGVGSAFVAEHVTGGKAGDFCAFGMQCQSGQCQAGQCSDLELNKKYSFQTSHSSFQFMRHANMDMYSSSGCCDSVSEGDKRFWLRPSDFTNRDRDVNCHDDEQKVLFESANYPGYYVGVNNIQNSENGGNADNLGLVPGIGESFYQKLARNFCMGRVPSDPTKVYFRTLYREVADWGEFNMWLSAPTSEGKLEVVAIATDEFDKHASPSVNWDTLVGDVMDFNTLAFRFEGYGDGSTNDNCWANEECQSGTCNAVGRCT